MARSRRTRARALSRAAGEELVDGMERWCPEPDECPPELRCTLRAVQQRWLLPATVLHARGLHRFGRFIANSDMHFGNLSFFPQDDRTLRLAPGYDMLPMLYAPIGSELHERRFAPPVPEPGQEASWFAAAELVAAYWDAVAVDLRITQAFRTTTAANAVSLRDLVARFSGRCRDRRDCVRPELNATVVPAYAGTQRRCSCCRDGTQSIVVPAHAGTQRRSRYAFV